MTGCKPPTGTCVVDIDPQNAEDRGSCALDYDKEACQLLGRGKGLSKFFEEKAVAGQLRCTELGYTVRVGERSFMKPVQSPPAMPE